MFNSNSKRKIYSTEFKQSSIKLALESKQPIEQTAKSLDIKPNTLYGWIDKQQTTAR